MKILRYLLIPLLLASSLSSLLLGCVSSSDKPQLSLWEHKLVGKIWDVRQQSFIDKATVVEHMLSTKYLLLGEQHDNLVHHQHQSWFIQQLRANQVQASVAFEMIDNDQGNHLVGQHITSANQMIAVLDQVKTNWQYKTRYQGLFSEIIAAGYHIDAANLNRKRLMHMVMQGEDKLPDAFKRMLDETQLSNAQLSNMQKEIKESHCHMMDDSISKKMVLGQRLRDAIMAHSLLKSQAPVKVLIAGGGHVRNDRGVPIYLGENSEVLSVGFMEVASDLDEVSSYAKRWSTEVLPFDIVWFTPKVMQEDQCEQIRQHLKNKPKDAYNKGNKEV